MTGRLVFVKHITRAMLRAEPEARFVFGDNVARRGLGGQAKEMRGEPNAIGVVTKWEPGTDGRDYFNDQHPDCKRLVSSGFFEIEIALADGRTVYFPADGIGTGLSELPKRAPELHNLITDCVADLARRFPA